jgi:hypothetical protein
LLISWPARGVFAANRLIISSSPPSHFLPRHRVRNLPAHAVRPCLSETQSRIHSLSLDQRGQSVKLLLKRRTI